MQATAAFKQIGQIATQKHRLESETQSLVTKLNELLPELGYKVVRAEDLAPAIPVNGNGNSARAIIMRASRKTLQCRHCPRKFAHAMHLARHTKSTHTYAPKPQTKSTTIRAVLKGRPVKKTTKAKTKTKAKAATKKKVARAA